MNRIESAHTLIVNSNNTKIELFLSGGKKNSDATQTEAQIMRTYFEEFTKNSSVPSNILYTLDEESVNTAENLMRAALMLNTTTTKYDKVYVVTSAFHYNRAKTMLGAIDPSREYQWILGDEELPDSNYWERIHINNAYADVAHARHVVYNI